MLEPLDLLAEIDAVNERIRDAGRQRLELVEQFNRELRGLIQSFEDTPDTFRIYVDLVKRLERIARRVEKAHADGSLDYTEHFDKALTVLKKRKFETATKELDRIPVLGLLPRQRQLFEEYKRAYAALRSRCENVESEMREMTAYYQSLQHVEVASFDDLTTLATRIDTYNNAVGAFLEDFFKQAALYGVLKTCIDASYHPELGFPRPPSYENAERLLSFVRKEGMAAIPLHRLLEYAKYSDNKLAHYVADTTAFRQVLESNITWLETLDDIKRRDALKLSLNELGTSLVVKIPRMITFLSKLGAPTEMLTFLRDMQKLVTCGRYETIRATTTVNRKHVEKLQRGMHVDDLKALQDEHVLLTKKLKELQEPRAVELRLA